LFSEWFALLKPVSGVAPPLKVIVNWASALTAAGVSAPEPASMALPFGGLLVIAARRKLKH
jgi:hypothetical protein